MNTDRRAECLAVDATEIAIAVMKAHQALDQRDRIERCRDGPLGDRRPSAVDLDLDDGPQERSRTPHDLAVFQALELTDEAPDAVSDVLAR